MEATMTPAAGFPAKSRDDRLVSAASANSCQEKRAACSINRYALSAREYQLILAASKKRIFLHSFVKSPAGRQPASSFHRPMESSPTPLSVCAVMDLRGCGEHAR
jgi:hypothetical protein